MAHRSTPVVTELTAPFWRATEQGRIELQYCALCNRFIFPPFPECLGCDSSRPEWREVAASGSINTISVVESDILPGLEELIPLQVALVALDGVPGVLIPSNVLGAGARSGDRVRATFEYAGTVALPLFALDATAVEQ